ncbi:MAG: hypothetical protein ACK44A_05435 [Roseateles sp.]
MSYRPKAYCGGVRTLEDVRQRCVINEVTTCWHLRHADGRPLSRTRPHKLWFAALERAVSVPRLVHLLAHPDAPVAERHWRTCNSYDCANPDHVRSGTAQQEKAWRVEAGRTTSPGHRAAAQRNALTRSVLTPELRQWLVESTQSHVDVAHGLGIDRKRAQQLRASSARMAARQKPGSIFDFAARAALDARRAA